MATSQAVNREGRGATLPSLCLRVYALAVGIDDITLDTWITSDHHWGHDNIVGFQGRPEGSEALMVERWKAVVGPDDLVLHLGDLVCYEFRRTEPAEHWQSLLLSLPGQKIMLRGNHDKHTAAWYEAAGFRVLGRGDKPFRCHRLEVPIAFSHEPVEDDGWWAVNIHGHIHGHRYYRGTSRVESRINACVEVTDYAPVRLRDILPA